MASASQYKGPYDVFLSFRGPDSRPGIISHIYYNLEREGIYPFKDDKELKKGDSLSQAFEEAIKGSRIAVIIFTRDFATSPWCLREVAKIMDCKKRNNLLVLPVFYCADPQEIRGGRKEYKEALDGYEEKYTEALEKYRKECKEASEKCKEASEKYKEALDRHENEYKEAPDGHEKEYKEALEKYLEKYRRKYKEAIEKFEKALENLEEVKGWRQALSDAGNMYGSEFNVWAVTEGTTSQTENKDTKVVAKGTTIHVENRDTKVEKFLRIRTTLLTGGEFRDEAELVKSIVREIWIRLKPIPLEVSRFRVGIKSRVEQLIGDFNLESTAETLKLGLWAMGGMGKTTLARALYNKIFKDFDGSAYVDGIKGTKQQTETMVRLQECLLSQMVLDKEIKLNSGAEGSSTIKKILCRKRVLLILDGVDDQCQIDSLAGDNNWFGKGSKIIFTTTNKLLLKRNEVSSHTVEPLKYAEARELFTKYARECGCKKIHRRHTRRALLCTYGVPLALKVLASDLAASEGNKWDDRLDKFTRSSSKSVHDALRVCYDGLDKDEQPIFLHIACFFNGWTRRYVEGVLKKCDPSVDTIVSNLIRRSLIKDENGILKVHELIELMGKNIVDEQCHEDAARRSRLWRLEDVKKVLDELGEQSGDKGNDEVNAIVLALPKLETINIHPGAFAKLRKLKFLIMINVKADFREFRDPICLPIGLSWFEWPECSASNVQLNSENNQTLLVRRHLFEQPEEP